MLHPRRPITVLRGCRGWKLSRGIAQGDKPFGVMPALHPLHYLLFSDSPEMESQFLPW